MKTTLFPVVATDHVSPDGVRVFSMSLCSKGVAHASVHFWNGVLFRFTSDQSLRPRRAAIERLASRYHSKSSPARFLAAKQSAL